MAAIPMIPMEPASEVTKVRPFLVNKFLKEREMAVKKDIPTVLEVSIFASCFSSK